MESNLRITKLADYAALADELSTINEQMRLLNRRRSLIKKALYYRKRKEGEFEYHNKPIILYVLELAHDCYYIGITRNMDKRYKTHRKGKGAVWTKKHPPLRIIEQRDTGLTDDKEAAKLEDELTLEYALMYGTEAVRGGGYCQTRPTWPLSVRNAARDAKDADILAMIREFV